MVVRFFSLIKLLICLPGPTVSKNTTSLWEDFLNYTALDFIVLMHDNQELMFLVASNAANPDDKDSQG